MGIPMENSAIVSGKRPVETASNAPAEIQQIAGELEQLHNEMVNLVNDYLPALAEIEPEKRPSASNLLHYLALRRHDIRALQERLAALGLSSLGRTEAHVLSAVRAVLNVLTSLDFAAPHSQRLAERVSERQQGRRLLERNTDLLLGPPPAHRKVRIMVTVPSEAATDYALVRDLLAGGMNVMRINCAHDSPESWYGMIRNLRQAEQELGKPCKVEMDVAGPKLRTGPIAEGPAVIKYRPKRDDYGRVKFPACIWLTPSAHPETPSAEADAILRLPARWLAALKKEEEIRFFDARGAKRSMTVREKSGRSRWAESEKTAYIAEGLILRVGAKGKSRRAHVFGVPPKPQFLLLKPGDILILTRSLEPGRPARLNVEGDVVGPARIGVTLAKFFDCAQPGEPVWLDDGKFGGVVTAVERDQATVEIKQAPAGGGKLSTGKGVNAPETNLQIPCLTDYDLKALEFIVKHADILGFSFVRTEEDVRALQARLAELGAPNLGIVLKIETRQGFENLPSLLLAAMRSRAVGVMIARGDLAVECGYQRLAEAQEEILWISEAAHVPVIWATQVLESLAKTGMPSRSEITDAAMGERAECVMLNKGPYVVEAVKTLDDILRRMQAHQEKKRSMLRKLRVATGFAA
jgi:pyruvate kinase